MNARPDIAPIVGRDQVKQFRTKMVGKLAQMAVNEIQSAAAQKCDTVIGLDMEAQGLMDPSNSVNPWRFHPETGMYRQEILPDEIKNDSK